MFATKKGNTRTSDVTFRAWRVIVCLPSLARGANMKFVLITKDPEVEAAAREGFHPSDECLTFPDWADALNACQGADLLFVDLIATLIQPHEIAGYERFAMAKMAHRVAAATPLILIAPSQEYDMDYMAGWPDFVFGHVRRPVNYKIFRRASTWV